MHESYCKGVLLCDLSVPLEKFLRRCKVIGFFNLVFSASFLYRACNETGPLFKLSIVLTVMYFFDANVLFYTGASGARRILAAPKKHLFGVVILYSFTWIVNLLFVLELYREESHKDALIPMITLCLRAFTMCLICQLPGRVHTQRQESDGPIDLKDPLMTGELITPDPPSISP
jgi:hypothetical protein